MSARARVVGEGPCVFIERIPGGDKAEVASRLVGGGGCQSWCRGEGRVDTEKQSGREGGE